LTTIQENGPQIKIYSPNLDEPVRIPFLMDIAFEAPSDKTVDPTTLSIKYLKLIPIDLTGRMKPYLNDNRLVIKDLKSPAGKTPAAADDKAVGLAVQVEGERRGDVLVHLLEPRELLEEGAPEALKGAEIFTLDTGALLAWVKVPSISSSANTDIYMYYGNPDCISQGCPKFCLGF
jgi:hypothetical protein